MKNNKLIAEFMGLSHCEEGWITIPNENRNGVSENEISNDLQYHTSWDWLMPVIEKIENDGLDPHEMIDNSLRKNNQKRWRSIEDLHNVAVYLINIYNNER
tara:strand:- start:554 stop:856 length:303 start_codon:yes stop_codon:yes gene_type:complete